MQFYDQHMHSYLSFDSIEDPYRYITPETETLVLTDHLDLDNHSFNGEDTIPDFEHLFKLKEEMKETIGVELLTGVEVGYTKKNKSRLEEILASHDFDLKILSCHQNETYNYMDPNTGVGTQEKIHAYLNDLYEAVSTMNNFQIMAHFDFGLRVDDVTVTDLEPLKEKFIAIFEKCIQQDMAFELNSKSLFKHGNYDLYDWAVSIYRDIGGELFSLGSDAHHAKDYMLNFEDSVELLRRYGVEEVTQYKNKKLNLISLDEVEQAISRRMIYQ